MLRAVLLLLVFAAGCQKPPTWFEPEVRITRLDVPRRDPQTKEPISLDAEISYDSCPGAQIEVMRGGPEFAKCMLQHKAEEKVKARLLWHPDGQGGYTWEVHEVAGCKRPPDPKDEASFRMVRDCSDLNVNGVKVGFHCEVTPGPELVKACPWFRAR